MGRPAINLRGIKVSILVCGLALATTTAFGGDDDKQAAYKIYIDPETGRYTTEEPDATAKPPSPFADPPRLDDRKPLSPVLVGAVMGLLALASAGIILKRRRHNMQR